MFFSILAPVINLRRHIGIAIFYFLLVAVMGIAMRLFIVQENLGFINYKYLTHAHSHVALLGWIYLGIITLIYYAFLKNSEQAKQYRRIFIFTNISIVGMLLTFPIQGYALFSIIFSTLFLFISYWFAWFAMKYRAKNVTARFSWRLIKASLWYMVLSSIGPWAIGGVMATLGSESIWYKSAIYFYLHFQYNGWFVLALLGIFFYILEEKGVTFDPRRLKSFFFLLNVGIILSLFLSILWVEPPIIFYILGGIGAVAQAQAFYELYMLWKPHFFSILKRVPRQSALLLRVAAVLMASKVYMQMMSAIPYYAKLAYQLKDFVIGYLHLVFLGVVIPLMLVLLKHFKLIRISNTFLYLFLITVAVTEILIFYKAFALWLKVPLTAEYYTYLAYISCLFPVAIGILFANNIFQKIRINT